MKPADGAALELEWWAPDTGDRQIYALLQALTVWLPQALGERFTSNRHPEGEELSWPNRMLFRDAVRSSWGADWDATDEDWLGGRARVFRYQDPIRPLLFVTVGLHTGLLLDLDIAADITVALGQIGTAIQAYYGVGIRQVANTHKETYGGAHWAGLPTYNVALEWFGPAYVPLVLGELLTVGGQVGSGIAAAWRSDHERLAILPAGLLGSHRDQTGPPTLLPEALHWRDASPAKPRVEHDLDY